MNNVMSEWNVFKYKVLDLQIATIFAQAMLIMGELHFTFLDIYSNFLYMCSQGPNET